ncbi:MAG: 2OG-Fe(II) oxygenase family protein [Bryobacteraceae bacterium]
MELEVTPAFPTLIGQLRVPDPEVMNRDLQALILAEELEYSSVGRSNIRGWHSRPDFLKREDAAVSSLRTWLTWALRRMIDATAGANAFDGALSASAWATICRAGAYHAPHSHPDSAWSGVYYVNAGSDSPDQPLSGVLEFLDPRAGVDAVTAPGDPYGEPFRVRPQAGLLVIFPSWLYHWVHPYTGQTPRIAISFNATVASAAEVKASAPELSPRGAAAGMEANEQNAAPIFQYSSTSALPEGTNDAYSPIIE